MEDSIRLVFENITDIKDYLSLRAVNKVFYIASFNCKLKNSVYPTSYYKLCANGKLDELKYLHLLFNNPSIKYNYDYVCLFETACQHNQFEVAKWLSENFDIIINAPHRPTNIIRYYDMIDKICILGNLEFAKWLYNKISKYICFFKDYNKFINSFKEICYNKHFETAEWYFNNIKYVRYSIR